MALLQLDDGRCGTNHSLLLAAYVAARSKAPCVCKLQRQKQPGRSKFSRRYQGAPGLPERTRVVPTLRAYAVLHPVRSKPFTTDVG